MATSTDSTVKGPPTDRTSAAVAFREEVDMSSSSICVVGSGCTGHGFKQCGPWFASTNGWWRCQRGGVRDHRIARGHSRLGKHVHGDDGFLDADQSTAVLLDGDARLVDLPCSRVSTQLRDQLVHLREPGRSDGMTT